jgi:hypothetical protein
MDLYVTLCISIVLIKHIRRVKHANLSANINLFLAIGATNCLRTIILMMSNIASAALILSKVNQVVIMITWPIINLLFVLLVGYDTDIARVLRILHQAGSSSRQNSSGSGLSQDLAQCNGQNYSSDKCSNVSSQSANRSSQQNDSTYQLQPTHISSDHSPNTLIEEERGQWPSEWEEDHTYKLPPP